jgi:hypothetical protein
MSIHRCRLCNDPAKHLLPCCHLVCDGCLSDMVQDGVSSAGGPVCKVDYENSERRCVTQFVVGDVVDLMMDLVEEPTEDPIDLEDTHASVQFASICVGIANLNVAHRPGIVGRIAALDQLVSALLMRKTGIQQTSLIDQATKEIDADIKAVQNQHDLLVVQRDHIDSVASAVAAVVSGVDAIAAATMVLTRVVHLQQMTLPPLAISRTAHYSARFESISKVYVGVDANGAIVWGRSIDDYVTINLNKPRLVFGSYGSGDGQLDYPRCTAITQQATILVGDCNNRVQEFTPQGQHMRYLAKDLDSSVAGLAVTSSGDVWVSTYNSDVIQLRSGTSGALTRSIECTHARVLALLPDGSLAVGSAGNSQVVLFDPHGTQRWTSTGSRFNYVFGVAAVDNELFVCEYSRHRIQVLSVADGRVLREFGSEQMRYPSRIAYDANARVLLVLEDDKVSVWSLNGNRLFAQRHRCTYRGLAIGEDGTVYLCGTHHILVI